MSETVAISLITAAAGFSGALLGALAAVVGPWWLRRSDRLAQASAESLEARRLALVEWMDAEVDLASWADGDGVFRERQARCDRASTLVASRMRAKDEALVDWLAGLSTACQGLDTNDRVVMLGGGANILFRWHRGTLATKDLTPFEVKLLASGQVQIKGRETWRYSSA